MSLYDIPRYDLYSVTVEEAAAFLRLPPDEILSRIQEGQLFANDVGGVWMIERRELAAYRVRRLQACLPM